MADQKMKHLHMVVELMEEPDEVEDLGDAKGLTWLEGARIQIQRNPNLTLLWKTITRKDMGEGGRRRLPVNSLNQLD